MGQIRQTPLLYYFKVITTLYLLLANKISDLIWSDIRVRIRINPKIRIRIPDHFGSNFGVGGGLCSLNSLVSIIIIVLVLFLFSVLLLLLECGQCMVTIVLNGEQSTLEFVSVDLKTLDFVRFLCHLDLQQYSSTFFLS